MLVAQILLGSSIGPRNSQTRLIKCRYASFVQHNMLTKVIDYGCFMPNYKDCSICERAGGSRSSVDLLKQHSLDTMAIDIIVIANESCQSKVFRLQYMRSAGMFIRKPL